MSETLYKMERDKLREMMGEDRYRGVYEKVEQLQAEIDNLHERIQDREMEIDRLQSLSNGEKEQLETVLAVAKQYDLEIDPYIEEIAERHGVNAPPPPKAPRPRKKDGR